MEKFDTIAQLLPLNSARNAAMSSSVNPVVPTTACMPCIASHGTVTRAASATVKSTTTSQPASASDRRSPVTVMPWRVSPTALRSIAATSSRSLSSETATHVARPKFPPAPTTPSLVCAMPPTVAAPAGPLASGCGTDGDEDRVDGQDAIDRALDGHLIDGRPAGHLLVDRTNRTGGDQLTSVPSHARASVFQTELESTGEVAHRDVELFVGDPVVDKLVQLRAQQRDDLVAMVGLGAGVHLEGATVGVRRHAGVHGVGQPTTLTDLFEQTTRQPAAEHLVDDVECLAVVVATRQGATAHHDVDLLRVVVHRIVATDLVGCSAQCDLARGAHLGERRGDELQRIIVGDGASKRDDHRTGVIMRFEEAT